MWKEFFSYVSPDKLSGVAGVANIGDDNDWCGHEFSQSNWYAFGRLAWNPDLSSEDIAAEWLAQTFTSDYYFVHPMTDIMMRSREACVDYMMPLGLHHIFKFDHHYGPEPDGFKPDYPIEWCPVYYHKADSAGIGFNRTSTGSGATSQYREPYRSLYDDINTCPEQYLLWFHHVEWNYKLKNGNTLWQNLCSHYNKGVREVQNFNDTWQQMRPFVDAERWNAVADRLHKQLLNAEEWRDVCLKYFQTFSKQQITNN
jgi:alpha-glucuronidase